MSSTDKIYIYIYIYIYKVTSVTIGLIGQVKPTKTVHPNNNLLGLGPNHGFQNQTQIKHQGLGKSDLNYCALAVLIYCILWC
jgi:hypothetical protein